MSTRKQVTIVCPECKKQYEITVLGTIDAKNDIEAKRSLLDGSLFRATCPHCEHKNNVNYTMTYIDEDHDVILYHPAYERDAKYAEGVFQEYKELSHRRMVSSVNEMMEKARIFDEGYDDRIMECLKTMAYSNILTNSPDLRVSEILLDSIDEKIYFLIIVENGEDQFVAMEKDAYWNFQKLFADRLSLDDNIVVNLEWALNFTQKNQDVVTGNRRPASNNTKTNEDAKTRMKRNECTESRFSVFAKKYSTLLSCASIIIVSIFLLFQDYFYFWSGCITMTLCYGGSLLLLIVSLVCQYRNGRFYRIAAVCYLVVFVVSVLCITVYDCFYSYYWYFFIKGEMLVLINVAWSLMSAILTIISWYNVYREDYCKSMRYRERCYARVRKMQEYLDSGIITQAEYEKNKREILSKIKQ